MSDWQKETLYKAKEQYYTEKAKKMIDSGIYEGFTVEELARFLFSKDYG